MCFFCSIVMKLKPGSECYGQTGKMCLFPLGKYVSRKVNNYTHTYYKVLIWFANLELFKNCLWCSRTTCIWTYIYLDTCIFFFFLMITIKSYVWGKSIFINRLQGCPLNFYTIQKESAVWRKDGATISQIWKPYIGHGMGLFCGKAVIHQPQHCRRKNKVTETVV